MNKIRKIPPVCLCIAVARLLTGRLKLSKEHVGAEFIDKNDSVFKIFRNILTEPSGSSSETIVFVVSFKFARLSHKTNKVVSLIPMLLIAGFPGFMQKMYAVNDKNGYWMGLYEWKSIQYLEDYKKSFVFRMMKKRAKTDTVKSYELRNSHLFELIEADYY